MITASKEFDKYRDFIIALGQKYNPPIKNVRLPVIEPLYKIDWNSRKVEAPAFIGVEGDHEAEYLFFEMDRFVDAIDLADCIGIVQFKNANNEEYYQLLTSYDTVSIPQKIIFGWDIQGVATKYSGNVFFSFKFFKINSGELVYEINTMPGKTKVYAGWLSKDGYSHNYSQITADSFLIGDNQVETWLQQIQELKDLEKLQVYWLDV